MHRIHDLHCQPFAVGAPRHSVTTCAIVGDLIFQRLDGSGSKIHYLQDTAILDIRHLLTIGRDDRISSLHTVFGEHGCLLNKSGV